MSTQNNIPFAAWLAYWRAMRVYHRYEVEGIEHLDLRSSALIVGYHGRPIAHDLCMLTVTAYERLGYMPHAVFHGAAEHQPILKWVIDGLGFVTGNGPGMEEAIARGEHIIVTPGGTKEGCRSFRDRYRVDWGDRTGYLKLALAHGLPIIPAAGAGMDDAYIGLNDGYELGKKLGVPHRLPVWLGIGIAGLWPISPPLPVKMRTVIGEPIDLAARKIDPRDRSALLELHREVTTTVQGLVDRARAAS